MSDALQRIASLASSLSHAELRVLLELTVRAEAAGATEITASSRHLAQATGLARASVQAAIDSLNVRRLIQSDAGSPTQPAVHRLVCLHAEPNTSGLIAEPLVAQSLSHPGIVTEPRVALRLSHGGLIVEPGVAQPVGQPGLATEPPRDEKLIVWALILVLTTIPMTNTTTTKLSSRYLGSM